ncbi:MAG TPA: chromate resistance protein ChrB domain-containing protein [Vicinamibacteria bacterium]|jgi:hypothetical protein
MPEATAPRWLLLIHQIPPRPAYLRVKIGRRLQALGAAAIKNSVYVLPRGEQTLEDFQWVRREIVAGRGEATVCEARFVEGHSDADVEALFTAMRDAEYAALAEDARRLKRALVGAKKRAPIGMEPAKQSLQRLRKQLSEVVAIDFFGAPGRDALEGLLTDIESRLRPAPVEAAVERALPVDGIRGRTWVTRQGVQVDRIASAWLIRRFIDAEARFKFVAGHDYAPLPGELCFDMFQAEFTHDGDLCTFEVLLRHFRLKEAALRNVAEIVHDIDLKDAKFSRPEAVGVGRLIAGIAVRHKDDEARLSEGAAAFASLYEYFKRKR